MKSSTKIPAFARGVFWSAKIENLDLKKDEVYIINQALAYGTLPIIKWLFKAYSERTIKKVFINQPIKDYTHPRFNFLANYLLSVKDNLDPHDYVRNLPRNTR
ncbi:hypothetical protein ISS42_00185 [Candidatus Shapirobacteria bacterium]|nr:hypothetical protein [Candidatus Shapirobacteria bacterium]